MYGHLSPWKRYPRNSQCNGYVEATFSFEEGTPPVLVMRIVTDSNGKYESILRAAGILSTGGGKMVGSRLAVTAVNDAKDHCLELLRYYLHGVATEWIARAAGQ